MKVIRVFDERGRLLREVRDAISGGVGRGGELCFRMPTEPAVIVLAPGTWYALEEWHSEPQTDALFARPATDDPDPGTLRLAEDIRDAVNEHRPRPDSPEPTGAVRWPTNPYPIVRPGVAAVPASNRTMPRPCICADLRCPVLLNPPTPEELAWFSVPPSQRIGQAPAWVLEGAPAPIRRQCSWEIGHDVAAYPHEWAENGWPYGPNEHHPRCPRNPHTDEEGQPRAAAGITSHTQHITPPRRMVAGARAARGQHTFTGWQPTPDELADPATPDELARRGRVAVALLHQHGHPEAASNVNELVTKVLDTDDAGFGYSREPDPEVTGQPIGDDVAGFPLGGQGGRVIPLQRPSDIVEHGSSSDEGVRGDTTPDGI